MYVGVVYKTELEESDEAPKEDELEVGDDADEDDA